MATMRSLTLGFVDRPALIERFRTGYEDVVAALDEITLEELDRRPPGSDWTAREIAHHLADS